MNLGPAAVNKGAICGKKTAQDVCGRGGLPKLRGKEKFKWATLEQENAPAEMRTGRVVIRGDGADRPQGEGAHAGENTSEIVPPGRKRKKVLGPGKGDFFAQKCARPADFVCEGRKKKGGGAKQPAEKKSGAGKRSANLDGTPSRGELERLTRRRTNPYRGGKTFPHNPPIRKKPQLDTKPILCKGGGGGIFQKKGNNDFIWESSASTKETSILTSPLRKRGGEKANGPGKGGTGS